MMQRLAPALLLAFVLVACSGTTSDTSDAPAAASTSSTAAPTTTATTTTTSTTTTTTTTTTVAPTTTTVSAEFDTRPGTPPHEFDSYIADLALTMAFGPVEFQIESEGTWTRDAFRCDVTTAAGLLTTQSFIATPDAVWADKGNGYYQASTTAGSEQELVSSCPSSPWFWEAFVQEEFETDLGEELMFEGRLASRIDIANLPADFEDMAALAGFAGATVDHLVIWIDIETGVFLAMSAQMVLSEELMQGAGDTGDIGPVEIEMDFTISQVNDPTLVVEVP